jgi:hypothetical protein
MLSFSFDVPQLGVAFMLSAQMLPSLFYICEQIIPNRRFETIANRVELYW